MPKSDEQILKEIRELQELGAARAERREQLESELRQIERDSSSGAQDISRLKEELFCGYWQRKAAMELVQGMQTGRSGG